MILTIFLDRMDGLLLKNYMMNLFSGILSGFRIFRDFFQIFFICSYFSSSWSRICYDIFLFSEFNRFPDFFPDILQILIVFTIDLKAFCHFFRVDAIGCFFLEFFPYLYFQRVYDDNQKHLIFFPEFIRFPNFLQILTVFIFLREFFLNLPFLWLFFD